MRVEIAAELSDFTNQEKRMKVRVRGRYPARRPCVLETENIVGSACEDETGIFVRLDDKENPDFWMEIFVDKASEASSVEAE